MLSRAHRLTRGGDYRRVTRRGARASAAGLTVYTAVRPDGEAAVRFGFIVTKRVGVAVVRNRIRRRLKAICAELIPSLPAGIDVVFRVQPSVVGMPFDALAAATRSATERSLARGVAARSRNANAAA